MTDSGATPSVPRPLISRFALAVVGASFVGGAAVRWTIALVAIAQARHEVSGLQTILLGATLGLVIGYMVAVIVVGVALHNRERGGRFTVIFASVLLAVHLYSGMSRGVGILAIPSVESSLDFSWLYLVPPLFTVPAAVLRLIRWRWTIGVAAAGVALAAVLGAVAG
ncbi:hypothetical protein GCM10027413_12850 [Conyzicola nivalis]|uniref:Uncharacterized protein n=1 Tax=Conyzicola nivalis TaxID=1477021 RepID=A0A916SHM0_9MICO|nr:hypothetical protein [Conyzicola nivalis]GGB00542.1 hypothetical protein GCM10010979_13780 [Conyzicola nivalis]